MQDTPNTSALWTIQDIAAFYRRSIRQARRIVRQPDFPAHVRGDRFRWAADAVVAFATSITAPVETPNLLGPTNTGNRIVRNRMRVAS